MRIRGFIPEWDIHIEFQTKVLKQLKCEQPLLRGVFPTIDPRLNEEINQWNRLEFTYADRLPALVPQDEWERYELENRFLERHLVTGPYVPKDWKSTVQMFRHNWKKFRLASAHIQGQAEKQGKEFFRNPLIRCLGEKRRLDEYGLAA